MEYARQFVYASNGVRLSVRQWLIVAAAILSLAFVIPAAWVAIEPFDGRADYRLPYEFSQDYWHCSRWFRAASGDGRVMVIGDSVVWGEFAGMADTLTGQLNRLVGHERFANLGVNGLHPAAMLGLLRHHGRAIRGGRTIVVLNTLWMSSPRHDLREAAGGDAGGRTTLNHPSMLPQFWPRVPGYPASFEERAATVVNRAIPCFAWLEHLELKDASTRALATASARAGNDEAAVDDSLREPRIDDPLPRRFAAACKPVPEPAATAHGQPIGWEERGIPEMNVRWPAAGESLQWKFFMGAVRHLRSRGNKVCVWISPFNPYLLVPESRVRHEAMVRDMAEDLRGAGFVVFRATPPPSEEYADASHPLAAGYARLAAALMADESFLEWLE